LPGRELAALSVQYCADVAVLLSSLRADQPDLILLNDDGHLRMPLPQILASIKAAADVPCVLRSLRADDEEGRIAALEGGCDDWISFGVSEHEAVARIRAILRRTTRQRPTGPGPGARPERAWRLSPERRELYDPDGQPFDLTSAEFDLLHTIVQHRGAVVSRDILSRAVFRRTWYPQDRGIDNLAARLRRKLAGRSRNPQVVKAVRGIGYAFTGF
jgi:two-component system phosphate regulon response regulator OmpR